VYLIAYELAYGKIGAIGGRRLIITGIGLTGSATNGKSEQE
jgi:hypothetical protein